MEDKNFLWTTFLLHLLVVSRKKGEGTPFFHFHSIKLACLENRCDDRIVFSPVKINYSSRTRLLHPSSSVQLRHAIISSSQSNIFTQGNER